MAMTDDEIIRARLLVDERPLKRLIKKFYNLAAGPQSDLDSAYANFILELDSQDVLSSAKRRTRRVSQDEMLSYEREIARIQVETSESERTIAELKVQLATAQQERRNKIVYDSIAKEALKLPSRAHSSENIARLTSELKELEAEQQRYTSTWADRQTAFEAIVQSLQELGERVREEKSEQERRDALNEDAEDDPTTTAAAATTAAEAAASDNTSTNKTAGDGGGGGQSGGNTPSGSRMSPAAASRKDTENEEGEDDDDEGEIVEEDVAAAADNQDQATRSKGSRDNSVPIPADDGIARLGVPAANGATNKRRSLDPNARPFEPSPLRSSSSLPPPPSLSTAAATASSSSSSSMGDRDQNGNEGQLSADAGMMMMMDVDEADAGAEVGEANNDEKEGKDEDEDEDEDGQVSAMLDESKRRGSGSRRTDGSSGDRARRSRSSSSNASSRGTGAVQGAQEDGRGADDVNHHQGVDETMQG